jgi:hypothetical protein
MMQDYASVAVFIINLQEIQGKHLLNLTKVLNLLILAKKSIQYAEESLVHMIDIYLNPDQDMYYSCIEEKARMVDP